jgi:hypothetical protein
MWVKSERMVREYNMVKALEKAERSEESYASRVSGANIHQ